MLKKISKPLFINQRAFSTKVFQNYVGGQWTDTAGPATYESRNPATQELLGMVPQSNQDDFNTAVANAKDAFHDWKEVPLPQKVRMMLKYQALLKEHEMDLAEIICREHGKSINDAKGDVFRGYEVVEHACSFNSLAMGETMENVSKNIDIYSYRKPLGVCGGITPFNFPAMCPLWMYPLAITLGNTFVLKPSEKVPATMGMLVDLLEQSGVPGGVLNIVNGGRDTVNHMCQHPDIKAISFVGGNGAGQHIYKEASALGKRVQVNMGAKNHGIVMPDADKEDALNAMVGAVFGSSGQRCMALSVSVMVGDAQKWIPDMIEKAKSLSIGHGRENKDLCPMIDKASVQRAYDIIETAEKEGADLLLDGRNVQIEGYPDGNWLGPTVIDNVKPGMTCYDQEIFAPVMVILRADTLDEAIKLINSSKFGNGCAIFSRSGGNCRKFQHDIEVGQVGINLPIPVPLPMFSFTGNKDSMWGTANFYGKGAVNFYTQWKTITSRWKEEDDSAYKLSTEMPIFKKN